jgi:hypothetical protein
LHSSIVCFHSSLHTVRQYYPWLYTILRLHLLLLLQVYSVRDSNLCLTGTAEVPLAGVYMDKVLNEKVSGEGLHDLSF